ncbi:copper homeostasis membrane protein CopD [Erythrobacter sp. 3-20A1M]|uniref:copper homeostasis membrane protein CopD n=1 Tax=Erythrobacter sp. 3-20A1M TaxID=2653850 RepID=UPI001BFC8528|nr:copper homeostasis membrane protein CopD [Erythrobacter sp. 3-20A1M]QWC57830.1 copper homeostasis membrane protein CopD [Erythrobacter sp. 3-20A1M]
MIEPVVVGLRLLQYLGAMLLMGASLFFLYSGGPAAPWTGMLTRSRRLLLIVTAAVLAVASLSAVVAQSSLFAGSLAGGLDADALRAVGFGMDLGKAALVRAAAAIIALALLIILPVGRVSWMAIAALGTVATVSLAWLGHAAASEGPLASVHLASDILHVTAAAVWIGALFGFLQLLLACPRSEDDGQEVYAALHGFSGIGSAMVAILLLTGLINSWVLVGPDNIPGLWTTRYGQLLIVKIVFFGVMIGLATANRFRLTPALGDALCDEEPTRQMISSLRRSIALEMVLGIAVLFLVAWFGTMEPPAAM